MAGDISTSRHVIIVGANHRSSSLALRDRLFVEDPAVGLFFDRLRAQGVDEAMVLSTCDRVEVQAAHANRDAAGRAITTALAEQAGMDPAELAGALFTHLGAGAVRPIFTGEAAFGRQGGGGAHGPGEGKKGPRTGRAPGQIGAGPGTPF